MPGQMSGPSDPATILDVKHVDRDAAIDFGTYKEYLDSLSGRLTPAEEDAILADSKRDPQILAGLALAGSSRAPQFLKEALEKAPEDPLVHYAILARADSGFDRLTSAQKLASLVPNDAESWYVAAAEALAGGNRTLAIDYLRNAFGQSEYATLRSAVLAAKLEMYRLAGSSDEMAQNRVLLDNNQTIGDAALVRLHEYLLSGAFVIPPGYEEMAAILLNAQQKTLDSKGLALDSYFGARAMEMEYLRAFFRAHVSGENPEAARYLTAPASEMLSAANAEWEELEPILMFSNDKPGVYQRLSEDQRRELIERIGKEGEVSAFMWAYEERPDIFRSENFKPQGFSKKTWLNYLKSVGVPFSAQRK